jgi:hypothetical protein
MAQNVLKLSARLPRHLHTPPEWETDLPALTIVTVLIVCDGIEWGVCVLEFVVREVDGRTWMGGGELSVRTPRARAGLPE